MNYDTDAPPDKVAVTYGPEAYAKLAAVKARHDPHNQFRFNANVLPARAARMAPR